MGIKNLISILEKTKALKKATVILPTSRFSNKKITIDAFNWFYTFYYISRKKILQKYILENEPEQEKIFLETRENLINYLLIYINKWLKYNILPIFVFDGERRKEKIVSEKRRKIEDEKRIKYVEVLNELKSIDIFDLISKKDYYVSKLSNLFVIPQNEFIFFREFFREKLLPHYIARYDAEQVISLLNKEGKCSFVVSKDFDVLAFGAEYILRDFSFVGDEIKLVLRSKIITALELNEDQFIDLLIFAGCDFNNNIKNYGVGKGLNYIRKFNNIRNIPNLDLTPLNLEICYQIFKKEKLSDVLMESYHLEKDKIKDIIEKERNKELKKIYHVFINQEFKSGWTLLKKIIIKE